LTEQQMTLPEEVQIRLNRIVETTPRLELKDKDETFYKVLEDESENLPTREQMEEVVIPMDFVRIARDELTYDETADTYRTEFVDGYQPDFATAEKIMVFKNYIYGRSDVYRVLSANGEFAFYFNVDAENRVWISSVVNTKEDIIRLGVKKTLPILPSLLVVPAFDYADEVNMNGISEYMNPFNEINGYVDVSAFLNRIDVIRDFRANVLDRAESAGTEQTPTATGQQDMTAAGPAVLKTTGETGSNSYQINSVKTGDKDEVALKDKMTAFGELLKQGAYRNIFGGKEYWLYCLGANVEGGESLGSAIPGVRSAAKSFAESNNLGNVQLRFSAGLEEARSKIIEIAERVKMLKSEELPAGLSADKSKLFNQARIYCAISKQVLDLIEADKTAVLDKINALGIRESKFISVEEFLREYTMPTIVSDMTKAEDGKDVVIPMPFDKFALEGFARFNLSHILLNTEAASAMDDPVCRNAVSIWAQTISFITNMPQSRIMEDLEKLARESNDNFFFISNLFQIMLPPVAKIDMNQIREELKAAIEVFRAL